MKKEKLKLGKLKVSSFITEIDQDKLNTIYAGGGDDVTNNGSLGGDNCPGGGGPVIDDPQPVEKDKHFWQSLSWCTKITCG